MVVGILKEILGVTRVITWVVKVFEDCRTHALMHVWVLGEAVVITEGVTVVFKQVVDVIKYFVGVCKETVRGD